MFSGLIPTFSGEQGVDGVLNDQLRHYLPGFSCGGVGVVSAVDLEDLCPCHDLLGFAGVNKGSYAVDISVQNVVLRILVSAVDALLCEHDRNVRSGYSGYVGVVVQRTADLILDEIQSLSLASDLFSGDRNAADSLRSTFHQAVDMGLTHVTDNHDMVSAVPCRHSHSSDIVLESSGSDLCGDDRLRLRIDIAEELRRRKADALFQRLGHVVEREGSHLKIRSRLSPVPAVSSRGVVFEILQDFSYVQFFILIQYHICHLTSPPCRK